MVRLPWFLLRGLALACLLFDVCLTVEEGHSTCASLETECSINASSLWQIRQTRSVALQVDEASSGGICLPAAHLPKELNKAVKHVHHGILPPWPHTKSTNKDHNAGDSVRLAFLVQVCYKTHLELVRRTFDQLYDTTDSWLYLVDKKCTASAHSVRKELGLIGPHSRDLPNVAVLEAPHAHYYHWPRVQVVLDGLKHLQQHPWEFVIHLSESDYPVHSSAWIRHALTRQRGSNFIQVIPKCLSLIGKTDLNTPSRKGLHWYPPEDGSTMMEDPWYWWKDTRAVASCGDRFTPDFVNKTYFPHDDLERLGFIFGRSPEWVVLTRELVDYATGPKLGNFKKLIAMHAAADETFWGTLVLNIPKFTPRLSRQGWFIHWPPKSTNHSPDTLTEKDHLGTMLQNHNLYLFMRKVEPKASAKLLQFVDSLIPTEAPPAANSAASLLESHWEQHYNLEDFRCPTPPSKKNGRKSASE